MLDDVENEPSAAKACAGLEDCGIGPHAEERPGHKGPGRRGRALARHARYVLLPVVVLSIACCKPPPAPQLSAAPSSTTSIHLTWTGEAYSIDRKTGPGGTYAQIATVTGLRSFDDSSLSPNTEYCYRLSARTYCSGLHRYEYSFSNEACAATSKPAADFSFSPASPVTGQVVTFTDLSKGGVASWSWDFGDGVTSTLKNPTHVYCSGGSYNVTLTATNSIGSDSVTKVVTVRTAPPLADFTFAPSFPAPGQTVTFTDKTIACNLSWSWSFGDGATSTLQNPTHAYTKAGTYSITLTATNSLGSSSITKGVAVGNPPAANFVFSPSSPTSGEVVTFTDVSTPSATSWSWDFGDGTTSTAKNPTHAYTTPKTYNVKLTAANSYGSTSITKTLTVSSGSVPTADFTFTPPDPVTGQPVAFTDTSTGGPTGWSWSFGDGASSTLRNPTHTYATVQTYFVTLIATNSYGSKSITRGLVVAAPTPLTRSVTLPVAGHVTGAGGALFLTDVEIENPNAAETEADLSFFPFGGGAPSQVSLTLSPLETRSLPDVVATQFGVTNFFGSLRLDTKGNPPPLLRMTSRTYDRQGSGTLGTAVAGVVDPAPSAASHFVTGLQQNGEYRSAIGAVNTTTEGQNFTVVLRGPDGSILGTSSPIALAPGEQWQIGISALFPTVSGAGLTAEFQSVSGSNVPFAYGTLADNLSGDLTYYPAVLPATALYLPLASKITGRGGAVYESELAVSNVSDSSSNVTLTFFEHDRDNTNGAKAGTTVLAAHETRSILFGFAETYGALKIESDSPVVVTERINTASLTTSGIVGQDVDPILPDGFYSKASILGLRQDTAFRSNVGLFNANPNAAAVNLTLRRPSGEILATATVMMFPFDFREFGLAGLFPGISFPAGERLTIALDAGYSAVAAFGVIADNVSGDLIASPGLH